jgi:hypothetical protein
MRPHVSRRQCSARNLSLKCKIATYRTERGDVTPLCMRDAMLAAMHKPIQCQEVGKLLKEADYPSQVLFARRSGRDARDWQALFWCPTSWRLAFGRFSKRPSPVKNV